MFSDLLGKSFRYNGRGPDTYDCYGLAQEVLRRKGIVLPEIESADNTLDNHDRVNEHKAEFLELQKPRPWCIVTIMIQPPYTSHVGVVLEDGIRFIHIMRKSRVTIERLDSPVWKKRITGYYLLA